MCPSRDIAVALQQGEPSHGVYGASPLINALGLNLVWGVNPDYLHCALEGVTKQMCDSWYTSIQLECYIGAPQTLQGLKSGSWGLHHHSGLLHCRDF